MVCSDLNLGASQMQQQHMPCQLWQARVWQAPCRQHTGTVQGARECEATWLKRQKTHDPNFHMHTALASVMILCCQKTAVSLDSHVCAVNCVAVLCMAMTADDRRKEAVQHKTTRHCSSQFCGMCQLPCFLVYDTKGAWEPSAEAKHIPRTEHCSLSKCIW